jgi:hypothetical protein
MDDYRDLVLAMFGVAMASVMLVAGALFILTRSDHPEAPATVPAFVTSSVATSELK